MKEAHSSVAGSHGCLVTAAALAVVSDACTGGLQGGPSFAEPALA